MFITDQKNPLRNQNFADKLYYQFVKSPSERIGYEVIINQRKWTIPIRKYIDKKLTIEQIAANMFLYNLSTSITYLVPDLLNFHYNKYEGDKLDFLNFNIQKVNERQNQLWNNRLESDNFKIALKWLNRKKKEFNNEFKKSKSVSICDIPDEIKTQIINEFLESNSIK